MGVEFAFVKLAGEFLIKNNRDSPGIWNSVELASFRVIGVKLAAEDCIYKIVELS